MVARHDTMYDIPLKEINKFEQERCNLMKQGPLTETAQKRLIALNILLNGIDDRIQDVKTAHTR